MKRIVLLMVAAMSLTACSAEEPSTPGVVTLESPSTTKAATPAAGEERPVIRPDATEADIRMLENAYGKCLEEAGLKVAKDDAGNYGKASGDLNGAAAKKCAVKAPESWLERERRTDPDFADRLRAAVACLKEKGYQARVGPDGPKIAYASTAEFIRADEDQAACEREAFREAIAGYGND
jgi:hypothetical protein